MLKKIICILLCLLTISGCVSNDTKDFESQVNEGLKEAASTNSNVGPNNYTKYFTYYLPSDMTEDICDETYAVLEFYGFPIVMNLNISNMINSKYFSDVKLSSDNYFDSEKLLYTNKGNLTTKKNGEIEYLINIYTRDDTSVYIEFVTPCMSFHSVCLNGMLKEIIRHIALMVQYINVDEELVLKNYYDRDLIDYEKKNVDLFDRIIPANGRLDEMILDE